MTTEHESMFKTVLVPLENSDTDETILNYMRKFARHLGSKILLIHVADGFAARNQETLNLEESEEMRRDRAYLERRAEELRADGLDVVVHLACGEPAQEIVTYAEDRCCDLIAMSTHGHRFLQDLVLGSVASGVRHRTDIPVLLVRAAKGE